MSRRPYISALKGRVLRAAMVKLQRGNRGNWRANLKAFSAKQNQALKYFAFNYIWWLEADEAVSIFPTRILAQVMNLGTSGDWNRLLKTFDADTLKEVLKTAQAGWFDKKRWNFWHIYLSVSEPWEVPPLPKRPLPKVNALFR